MRFVDALLGRNAEDPIASEQQALSECYEILAWTGMPYHKTFMAYLEAECMRPLAAATEFETVKNAIRAATFREMRADIVRKTERAAAVVAQAREESNAG